MPIPPKIQRNINNKKNQNNNIRFTHNQKPKNSYFDNEERNNGLNWISTKRQTDFRHYAKFIIKDLVRGNVDIEKHCHYFNENIIINVLKTEATTQAIKYQNIYNAMYYYNQFLLYNNTQPNYDYAATMQEMRNLLDLYRCLEVCFSNIMVTQDAYNQLCILMENIKNNSGKFFIEDITY